MKLSRFFLLLCFVLLGIGTQELASFSLRQNLPFDADEAHHAARGLDVYDAVRSGSPGYVYRAIRDQSFYPPLHSLTVAAGYSALGGPSLAASRAPSWMAFLLSLFVTALAIRATICRRSDIPESAINYGMGVACLFGFFSPLSIQNASVCMLEPLSMLVTALILYIFAQHGDRIDSPLRSGLLVATILIAAMLTKYTMLIFVVGPALLALWGVPLLTPKLAHRAFLIAGAGAALGFGAWLTLSHWEGVWYFLIGFPKRGIAFSFDALLTQPDMFVQRCTLHPVVSFVALGLALFALKYIREQRVVLFSVLCIFATLAVLGVSKQQGGRFMLHALPCLWLLCGLGASRVAAQWRMGKPFLWTMLACMAVLIPLQRERLHADILRALETTHSAADMHAVVRANADAKAPILQIGSNDLFNLESVRWSLAAESGIAFREITVDQFPMNFERLDKLRYSQPWRAPFEKYRRQVDAPLEKALRDGNYKTLIVFEGERWLRRPEDQAQIAALLALHPHVRWTDGKNALTVIQF